MFEKQILLTKKIIIMKKIALAFSVLFILAISVGNFSCKPENPDPEPQDTTKTVLNEQSIEDATMSTDIYSDVIADVLVIADENASDKSSYSKTCPTVTLEPTVGYPKTLTIDYGTDGCDANGHTISGTVTATISDRLRIEGTTVAISFANFSVDSVEIDGDISLTINEYSLANHTIKFTAVVSNSSLTMPSGNISMNGTVDVTWNINVVTDYEDDTFDITSGDFTGTNKRGKSFTATVLETLVYTVECGTVVAGELQVETSDTNYPATIDFGDGTCDHDATVYTTIEKTIAGHTFTEEFSYTITLP